MPRQTIVASPGSGCPNYDGEELHRAVYRRLVWEGFPAGLALDNGAAARFDGTELVEVVVSDPAASGYRVGRGRRGAARGGASALTGAQAPRRRRLNSATHARLLRPIQIGVRRT